MENSTKNFDKLQGLKGDPCYCVGHTKGLFSSIKNDGPKKVYTPIHNVNDNLD